MGQRLFSNPDIPPFKNCLGEVLFKSPVNPDNKNLKTFAIVDIAQKFCWHMPDIEDEAIGLYSGRDKEQYEDYEPQLVELDPAVRITGITEWLLDLGFGNNVCCFIMSGRSKEELAEHFNSFTKVTIPNKFDINGNPQEAFLRFYDPRVFPDYIKNTGKQTVEDFFAPVKYILCENPDKVGELLYFYLGSDDKLLERKIELRQDNDA